MASVDVVRNGSQVRSDETSQEGLHGNAQASSGPSNVSVYRWGITSNARRRALMGDVGRNVATHEGGRGGSYRNPFGSAG